MNFGTPVPLLIGIILILGALALFFLDKFRPGYERDSDKVYAVLLLISGLFLLAHLDMELLASFQQLLMAGMLTTLLIESVRSRLPRTEPARDPRLDNRPPRPRYDERPPVRRGYRAELDDNRGVLRDRPLQPRMSPAQEAYWQDEYSNGRPRQPYEEYRGPAGRLQPSRKPNPSGPPDNRYSDNNQYGERPPATRPIDRPNDRPMDRGPMERGPERTPERGPDNRPADRGPDPYQQRPATRPPETRPERPSAPAGLSSPRDEQVSERNARSAAAHDGERTERPARSANGDRALNIRPYSEAPNLDE
ncbi:MAG: Ycf66 family protein [Cyanobacteria bacterium J06632_3]